MSCLDFGIAERVNREVKFVWRKGFDDGTMALVCEVHYGVGGCGDINAGDFRGWHRAGELLRS